MRRRKIIVISAVALLGAALVMFLLMRDTGPPVKVNGNFSAKDVAEIKSAVKRELWKEAFPNFSWNTIKALPRSIKRVVKVRVIRIENGWSVTGRPVARATIADPYYPRDPDYSWLEYPVTNGPAGWTCGRLEKWQE